MNPISPTSGATAAEAPVYRPVSGLAILGCALAALFAFGIVSAGSVALYTGVPLLVHPMVLLIPLAAGGLSIAAWIQIARSEGTQSGLVLAQAGLGLAVLFGAGYYCWRWGKEKAVQLEAESFTNSWLDQLRNGQPHTLDCYVAFWNVLDPDRRDPRWPLNDAPFQERLRNNPRNLANLKEYLQVRYGYGSDAQRVTLPRFLDHELIQLVSQHGTKVDIHARGLHSWDYRGEGTGAYLVEQSYQITTPEGTYEARITVLGSHSKSYEGRQWQVLLDGTALEASLPPKRTPLGRQILALRRDSREFARDWASKLAQGRLEEAYLDTRPPAERLRLRNFAHSGSLSSFFILGASAQGAGPGPVLAALLPLAHSERARELYLPEYTSFQQGLLLEDRELIADPSVGPALVQEIRQSFRSGPRGSMAVLQVANADSRLTSPWQQGTDLVFLQPFRVRTAQYVGDGFIRVATTDPDLLQGLNPAGASDLQLPAGQRPLRWRIVNIELQFGRILSKDDDS